MRVVKDYGAVATHGSKELKLQIVLDENKEKKLALVSYKDGMSVRSLDITDEAKPLRKLLEGCLNYKAPTKVVAKSDVVHSLTSLPAGDCSYQTALDKATKAELETAIAEMKQSDGKHATRIKACTNALKNKAKVTPLKAKACAKDEPKKEEKAKVVQFPTEDKRPKVVKLTTEGANTYEDCVVKLNKEAELFKDEDSRYVITGLLELCKVDADFRNNVMRKDKTYGGFMEYMFEAAKKGYCIKYGNVGWIDRDTGLGLAIDYYNTDIDAIKAEEEAKRKAEAEKRKKEADKNGKTKTTKRKKKTTA